MIYETDVRRRPYPIRGTVMKGNLPFMNHCHQEMEILQVKKGDLRVTTEEESFDLEEGDIWIVPPFTSHSIGKSGQDCERLALLVDLKMIGSIERGDEGLWAQRELGERVLTSRCWAPEDKEAVRRIIEQLYREIQNKNYAWIFAVKTLICELVLIAVRQFPEKEKTKQYDKMAKLKDILEYIALNYYKELTLRSCADAVGFNAAYLSRYFSRHMGITFQEYVKRLRIDRAKWLLMTEEASITEICYQSGFHDIKTFNKLFRRECGMNPTEFRKSTATGK